jgi:hypothetical protein
MFCPTCPKQADELCFIKSMHTEAINHDPAITFCQTGHQLAGRPSIGSWLSYGLGTENSELTVLCCSYFMGYRVVQMINLYMIDSGVPVFFPLNTRE